MTTENFASQFGTVTFLAHSVYMGYTWCRGDWPGDSDDSGMRCKSGAVMAFRGLEAAAHVRVGESADIGR